MRVAIRLQQWKEAGVRQLIQICMLEQQNASIQQCTERSVCLWVRGISSISSSWEPRLNVLNSFSIWESSRPCCRKAISSQTISPFSCSTTIQVTKANPFPSLRRCSLCYIFRHTVQTTIVSASASKRLIYLLTFNSEAFNHLCCVAVEKLWSVAKVKFQKTLQGYTVPMTLQSFKYEVLASFD